MKKISLFLLSLLLTVIVLLSLGCTDSAVQESSNADESSAEATVTENSETEMLQSDVLYQQNENETTKLDVIVNNSLFTVDSWLKILSIENIDGKTRLIAENISDEDVEFALLRLKTDDSEFTFNISAVLSGERVYLVSNEEVNSDIGESFIQRTIENKISYSNNIKLNDDVFEIAVTDGAISVKNISDKNIETDIFVYYKEKTDNLLNGSVTHRVRVSGLNADALTYIKVDGVNEENCQIIFTEYEQKI